VHSRPLLLALLLGGTGSLAAQAPPALTQERAEYAEWLRTAPTSPFAAIALQRIGPGVTLGPEGSDVVLAGIPAVRVVESGGRVSLDSAGASRALPRNRVAPLGTYRLLATGTAGRTTLTVYGVARDARVPGYFPWLRTAVDTVELLPPGERRSVVLLAPEGADVEAGEAGTVVVDRFGAAVSLRVRRFPGANEDDGELEIFFRDGTSGQGSYPAGRFVSLEPLGSGKYRLDFNRARNPFCAYNTVFPCPAPWAGNTITARVEAGETYAAAKPR
jgi:hypothetical protein